MLKNKFQETEYCAFLQKTCIQGKCAFWLDACKGIEGLNQKEGFSVLSALSELIQANHEFEEEAFTGRGMALRNFLAFADPDYGRYIFFQFAKGKSKYNRGRPGGHGTGENFRGREMPEQDY